jgi:hypothetical protein
MMNLRRAPNMCLRGYDQCWSGIVFLLDNLVSITRISHYLKSVGYEYLSVFLIWYHSNVYTMQESSYLGDRDLGIQRFSHVDILTLTYSPKFQYLTDITILIPMSKFSDTISNVDYWYHAFTYLPDQHWDIPDCRANARSVWNLLQHLQWPI